MYSTCLFCHAPLGRNEALEHFPVGRRLAYDAAKGRLWVVCARCERWNLTPQEERWEAIDEAERLFRATRLRTSTDNVGLARVADGADLVRIGAPLRPEFAAWRYGDQFGRRRRKRVALAGGLVAAAGLTVVTGPIGLAVLAAMNPLTYGFAALHARRERRQRFRIQAPGGWSLLVGRDWAQSARFIPARDGGSIRLEIGGMRDDAAHGGRGVERYADTTLEGRDAISVAAQLLPLVNGAGGSPRDAGDALALLDVGVGTENAIAYLVAQTRDATQRRFAQSGSLGALGDLRPGIRLALEMATHEEQERRAMEGELAELERAWRAAEEIAGIADDLLLPPAVGEQLDQLRARSTARAGAASSPASESGSASNS